jgi:hypothetical protein
MTGVNAWIRWTPEEEKRLLNLIAAGKSWTLISGTLKRSMKSVKFHAKTLAQKRPPRAGAEGEGEMTKNRSFLLGVGVGLFLGIGVGIGLFGTLAVLVMQYVAAVLAG